MSFNVAITGATGFIGSAVLAELLAISSNVTVLLRPETDCTRLSLFNGLKTITYSNLISHETVDALSEHQPDIFIHCGWRGVGGQQRNEAFQITENIPVALEAVELAAASGCKKWIGLGSQAEYGNQNRRLDENASLQPTTLYGKAKLAAGIAALALCEARQMQGVWLRVFSTYGPDDAPYWFLPYVIQEFLGGRAPKLTKCEQLWDYLYVTDAARAIIASAISSTNGVYNLGSGSSRPLRDYIEAIRSQLGSTLEPDYGAIHYRPDQVMLLEADITKLTSETSWLPKISLAVGIAKTIEYERNIRNSLT